MPPSDSSPGPGLGGAGLVRSVVVGVLALMAEFAVLVALHELSRYAAAVGWRWPVEPVVVGGFLVVLGIASASWAVLFVRVLRAQEQAERAVAEQRALALSERHFSALARHAADLITVVAPDTTVLTASPAALSVLGVPAPDLVGRPFASFLDGPDRVGWFTFLDGALRDADADASSAPWAGRLRRSTGDQVEVEVRVRDLTDEEAVGGIVLTVRDVSEHRRLEATLRHQTLHDALTGLANRDLFLDRLAHRLARRDSAGQVCVLVLDLAGFKTVNDSLGHAAGDRLLVEVATRLSQTVRAADTAARLGADEFAVLCDDVDDAAQALLLADRLVDAVGLPLAVGDRELRVRVSIGLAVPAATGTSAQELLRDAHIARNVAKREAPRSAGAVRVYEPGMHEALLAQLELKRDLADACGQGQLRLEYQPTVDISTGRWKGVEALLRWEHPVRGLIPPLEFIPLAEQTDDILAIGRWALRTACAQAVAWDRSGVPELAGLSMAVNVSVRQLAEPDLVPEVLAALAAAGLPPQRLVLEVTESVLLSGSGDGDGVVGRLRELHDCGVRVAVDDFGTGYSSLAYLQQMPVDILKIDKSFVDGLGTVEGTALVESIMSISGALGLVTVAEGIEHAAQSELLEQLGCPVGQGWHYARALRPEAFESAVAAAAASEVRSAELPAPRAPEAACVAGTLGARVPSSDEV